MSTGENGGPQRLLDALPFGAWETDITGALLTANAGVHALTTCDTPRGTTLDRCLPGALADAVGRLTEEVLAAGVVASDRNVGVSGPSQTAVYDVEVRPRFDDSGAVDGTIGTVWDVTSSAVAQAVSEDHRAFERLVLGLAVEFVNVPLAGLDDAIDAALARTGEFTGVDRAYLFTYDFDERTTTNTHEWCAPGVEPMIDGLERVPMSLFPTWLDTTLRGEVMHVPSVTDGPVAADVRKLLAPQGVETVLAVPLLDRGACLGFVGFDVVGQRKDWSQDELALLRVLAELFTNAQVRRRHEEELVAARRTAESASAAKSRFLSVVSHELRTPMHGVLGMVELLSAGALTDEQRRYARVAQDSARALLSLLDDLLETARIEAGTIDFQPSATDVREIVEQVRALAETQTAGSPVGVALMVDDDVPAVLLTDGLRVRQILTNLTSNAVKFTDAGEVRVRVGLADGVHDERATLRILVADTGIGVEPDTLPTLFAPFARADGSATRRQGGTGLGLAIVAELVEAAGGRITASTEPGVGSTFVVELPVRLAGAPLVRTSEPWHDHYRARRVLIVDDNEVNQEVVRAHLEDLGCAVDVVDDGAQAVHQARTGGYDLVLMDCFMPVVDGFEAVRQISGDARAGGVPVVAVTADATEATARMCREAGMCDVLVKPFGRGELVEVLGRWTVTGA